MQKQQYVGKSLEDALDQAARALDTERENLSYNILPSEGGSLLKKLLFRSIRVEAWVEKSEDLHEAARKAVREAIEGGASQRHRPGDRKGEPRKQPEHSTAGEGKDKGNNRNSRGNDGRSQGALPNPGRTKPQNQKPPREGSQGQSRPQNSNQNQAQRRAGATPADGSRRRPTGDSAPRREQNNRSQQPRTERPVLESANPITFDTPGVTELLHDYTTAFMKVFDATLEDVTFTRLESGDMSVTVQSETLEELLSRSDRLCSSYEHVFKRITQKKLGDLPERLLLDSGSASEKRMEGLREMARSMAAKVKETGKSITLNSRSGQERRVIHLTIDEIEGVATRSMGTGDGRKLVIYSTERARSRRGGSGRSSHSDQSGEGTSEHEWEGATEDAGVEDNHAGDGGQLSSRGGPGASAEERNGRREGGARRGGRSRRGRSRGPRSPGQTGGGEGASRQAPTMTAKAPGSEGSEY
jgi:spoIIIJ-associated protein